ncbi:hypothetical protein HD806DRAFT_551307 [Xylariaceae sp. AK1471]|nr:hypothetical protein HD806DRAFT_551307 [Xylariaceae sp. AK1471]
MEVVGLVAAIPGLVDLLRTTILVIRAFADTRSFVKHITELVDQLELIERILQDILGRLRSSSIPQSDFDRLGTIVKSLRGELKTINDLFEIQTTRVNGKSRLLKRARLLMSGLEGKLKEHQQRLDKTKSSLILLIVTQNEAIAEGMYYKKNLEDIIKIALNLIKSDVYCIIDSIDESVDDWTRPDTGGLRLVLELAKSHTNLRLILLGRDASMRPAVRLMPLKLEITEDLVRADLDRLILHHLDRSPKIQDLYTRKLVQKTLRESSRAMFLWVTLIFGELSRCQLQNEIVYTLQQVPCDLDREYHRLFLRLQERLGGIRKSPSLPMQRAKCILSLITAAPEPLTVDELLYAFAISYCRNRGHEHYLISQDGVIDTCGDFIRVSDGRYHLAHASVGEFLTRPIEIWQDEDEAIDYFQVDVLQAQREICLACIGYLRFNDLGCPIVDSPPESLKTHLPFLSCALKFTLLYLMSTYASEHREAVWKQFEEFLKTSQFCALVEYGFLSIQNDSSTSWLSHAGIIEFISWISIAETTNQNPIKASIIIASLEEEVIRRENTFGLEDDRCRNWRSLIEVIVGLLRQFTGVDELSKNNAIPLQKYGHDSTMRRNVGVQIRDIASTQQTAVLKIGQAAVAHAPGFQAFARMVTGFTPELLPIPLLIILATTATDPARENQYWSVAFKRLTGTNHFLEAYCAFQLGVFRYQRNNQDEEAEGLLKLAWRIASDLPPSLHVEVLICSALDWLAWNLFKRDKAAEARETTSELQQRLSKRPTKAYISAKIERRLYESVFWDDWKAELLASVAKAHLQDLGSSREAFSLIDSNIHLYDNPRRARVDAIISARHTRMVALFNLRCDEDCEAACRLLQQQLTEYPNCEAHMWERWDSTYILFSLLWEQHRKDEAKQLLSQVPAVLPSTGGETKIIRLAARAAELGDLKTARFCFELIDLKVRNHQATLLQFESSPVTDMFESLAQTRPIMQLRHTVWRCYQYYFGGTLQTSHTRDWWYRNATEILGSPDDSLYGVWDVLYARHLEILFQETSDIRIVESALRRFAGKYVSILNPQAAAVIYHSLGTYLLKQIGGVCMFQMGLRYITVGLYHRLEVEKALLVCRAMAHCADRAVVHDCGWHQMVSGSTSFWVGKLLAIKREPLAAEFLTEAVISYTRALNAAHPPMRIDVITSSLQKYRSALEDLGITLADTELNNLAQVGYNRRNGHKIAKKRSCPDLRDWRVEVQPYCAEMRYKEI